MEHKRVEEQTRTASLYMTHNKMSRRIFPVCSNSNAETLAVAQALTVPVASAKSAAATSWSTFILTDTGEVWEKPKCDTRIYSLSLPQSITAIACNAKGALFLSSQGEIFTLGQDAHSGVFGQDASAQDIQKLQGLAGCKVQRLSLGATHAAAVDSAGQLITWGTGHSGQLCTDQIIVERQCPTVIESARLFEVKEVACRGHFTCFRTAGGHLYLCGRIPTAESFRSDSLTDCSHTEGANLPYKVTELEAHFIVAIAANEHSVVVLNENAEVYVFDSCLELIRLPAGRVTDIHAQDEDIYGLSENGQVLVWGNDGSAHRATSCRLAWWAGKEYLSPDTVKVLGLYDGGLVAEAAGDLTTLGALHKVHAPFVRSPLAQHLIDSIYEGLESGHHLMSYGPPRKAKFELSSNEGVAQLIAYPRRFDSVTFQKILKYRKEHAQREVLLRALGPLVYPLLGSCFALASEYCKLKREFILKKFVLNVQKFHLGGALWRMCDSKKKASLALLRVLIKKELQCLDKTLTTLKVCSADRAAQQSLLAKRTYRVLSTFKLRVLSSAFATLRKYVPFLWPSLSFNRLAKIRNDPSLLLRDESRMVSFESSYNSPKEQSSKQTHSTVPTLSIKFLNSLSNAGSRSRLLHEASSVFSVKSNRTVNSNRKSICSSTRGFKDMNTWHIHIRGRKDAVLCKCMRAVGKLPTFLKSKGMREKWVSVRKICQGSLSISQILESSSIKMTQLAFKHLKSLDYS